MGRLSGFQRLIHLFTEPHQEMEMCGFGTRDATSLRARLSLAFNVVIRETERMDLAERMEFHLCILQILIPFSLQEQLVCFLFNTDGKLKLFDLRMNRGNAPKRTSPPLLSSKIPKHWSRTYGFTSVAVDSNTMAWATCRDSKIYGFNLHTLSLVDVKSSPDLRIDSFYIRVSVGHHGAMVCGSSTGDIFVWKDNHHVVLKAHSAEVGCVDWSHRNQMQFLSSSDDETVRVGYMSSFV